jgi:hypothetical protein
VRLLGSRTRATFQIRTTRDFPVLDGVRLQISDDGVGGCRSAIIIIIIIIIMITIIIIIIIIICIFLGPYEWALSLGILCTASPPPVQPPRPYRGSRLEGKRRGAGRALACKAE